MTASPAALHPEPASQTEQLIDATTVVCVGTNIPVELVVASGLRPVFLTGAPLAATPRADEFLEDRYGAESRTVLEQLLGGVADNAALLVFDRRFRDIFYYVKEMVRLGWTPNLPPLHMFDLILSRSFDQTPFNADQLGRLGSVLARVAGALPGAALEDVIREHDEWRAEVRRLLDFRRRGLIDGLAAFRALSARRVLDIAEHHSRLAELNARLADLDATATDIDCPRVVLLPGEPLYHDRLHAAVREAGGLVVAEDSEWGARLAGSDIGAGSALLTKYWQDATGAELRPFEARANWLRTALAEYRPDVVVVWVPPSDVSFGWDVPRLLETIRDAGTRPVVLRSDVLSDSDFELAVTQLREGIAR